MLLSAAGCGDLRSEPLLPIADGAVAARAGGTLAFSSTADYSAQSEQTAMGTTGAIQFTGSITTPTPCYEVAGAQRTSGSTVTLTVSARGTGGICMQVITFHNYTGSVSRLPAGTYTFEVVHEVGTSRSVAFRQEVVVR
jgi:hypothetical protein